jgi:uncharacterized protein (DUF2235 family)
MKNIVVCADGTGNTTIKGRGTNVFKLYEAVDQSGHRTNPALRAQAALYHDGVGTENMKWVRVITGATGWGLSRNVKQLYGEIARVYAPGDRLFLFGFSRGAFAVRTLAGLIDACGILDLSAYPTNSAFDAGVDKAYAEYRTKYGSTAFTWMAGRKQPLTPERRAELRARFSVRIPEFQQGATEPLIAFVGVWETVDAVGLPLRAADFVNTFVYRFKFADLTLSTTIGHACHALAVDEERESFTPVLWNEAKSKNPERIEQVWFSGVHSNVGGGYPRQGMSLVALDWMMTRAEMCGLRFNAVERELYRGHADVDDKMYDSRAGLGVFYRWKPRNIREICQTNGVGTAKVHRSVFERIARNSEGYAPGSIPPSIRVVSLSQSPDVTEAVAELVAHQHGAGGPLLERAHTLLAVGRWAYRLYFVGAVFTAWLMLKGYVEAGRAGTTSWLQVGKKLANALVSSEWVGLLGQVAWNHPWLIAYLVATFGIAFGVDHRLDRRYSEFWHGARLALRKALGLG